MFQEEKRIELCDCDYKGKARSEYFFIRFGEIATYDAYKTNIYNQNMLMHYGWVVSKQTLKLAQPIYYDDLITLTTHIRKPSHVIFPRYYEIKKENHLIGECASIWKLMDLEKRKIIKPMQAGIQVPDRIPMEFEPETLFPLDDVEYVKSHQVLYSDVDINGHFNNTRYIRLACDLIPFPLFNDHFISKISINYKKELPPQSFLDLYMCRDHDFFHIEGKYDQEVCFITEMRITKI